MITFITICFVIGVLGTYLTARFSDSENPLIILTVIIGIIGLMMSFIAPIYAYPKKAQLVNITSTPSLLIVEADTVVSTYKTLAEASEIKKDTTVYVVTNKNFWGIEIMPSLMFKNE